MICKEVFMASLAMRIVDCRYDTNGFTAFLGNEPVPLELVKEVNSLTPLIWSDTRLMFRADWERERKCIT